MRLLRQIFHFDHLIVAAFTLLIIKLMVAVAVNLDFLSPVVRAVENFSMTDIYYRIGDNGGDAESENIVTLVDMTDLSRRKDIAAVISEIKSMKPAALGVDIIFEGRQLDGDGDDILSEACLDGDTDNVVWAYKLTKYDREGDKFRNCLHSFFITDDGQREGFINMVQNPAKSIREYSVTLPYRDTVAYSLPAQIARIVSGREPECEGRHTINYRQAEFPVVGYDRLADCREVIEGHIVLLGTTQEERDIYYTPIGQKPGLEILAYTVLSIIEDQHVRHAGEWMVILWALLAGYMANLLDFMLTKRMGNRHSTFMLFITQSEFYDKIMSLVVMILITWASFELFSRYNYFVDTVLALSNIVLIEEGRLLYVALLAVLKRKTKWKWVGKSIYIEEI